MSFWNLRNLGRGGLLLLAGSALAVDLRAQGVITTVAGSTWQFPRAGMPALQAPLRSIDGMVADPAGNLYISDRRSNVVLRVSADGVLSLYAGNGLAAFSGDGFNAAVASLNQPAGLALDSAGNLYIADSYNRRIRKVGANGVIQTVAGGGYAAIVAGGTAAVGAYLATPVGVAFDAAGNLYISDSGQQVVRKVTPDGIIRPFAGSGTYGSSGDGGPATAATMKSPSGIALDSAGDLFIADSSDERIREVTTDGNIRTVAGNGVYGYSGDGGPAAGGSLNSPQGVAVDMAGNLYIADTGNQRIRKVSRDGTIRTVAGAGQSGYSGDGGWGTEAMLSSPLCAIVDGSTGGLLIGDTGNQRVRRMTIGGIISTVAGSGEGNFAGDGGPAIAAMLNQPTHAVVDRQGNLYIADTGNNRVRKVTADGIIRTVAGNGTTAYTGDGGPAASASLNTPKGIAVDAVGTLYIADSGNHVVRAVSPNGTIRTAAGTGSFGSGGDGGPATKATLWDCTALAFDSGGSLYIADDVTGRVRKVTPDGVIHTFAGGGTASPGDGGPATAASLSSPAGVAADLSGNIYISENTGYRVRKVTPDGIIRTVAGTGSPSGSLGDGLLATSASLGGLNDVAVDSAGNLYIADNRVHKVTTDGIIRTVAGNGQGGVSGDGGLATAAALAPSGLTIDASGKLYIVDKSDSRVRLVMFDVPTLQVRPTTLTFSAQPGDQLTAPQSMTVSASVVGLKFTAVSTAPWLSVQPDVAYTPATLQVSADATGMATGQYTAAVVITSPLASTPEQRFNVTFTIGAAQPPKLAVGSASLTFSFARNGPPNSLTLSVLNQGSGTVAFTAAALTSSGGNWLSVTPASGQAARAAPASLTVVATPGTLAPGTYSGSITVSAGADSVPVVVTMTVTEVQAQILLSQTGLAFAAVSAGGQPSPQTFGILNEGQGTLDWAARASTLSGGSWLSIDPSAGRVTRPLLDVSMLSATVNTRGMAPGEYYGKIEITGQAANSPQIVTVILTVLPEGSTPPPEVRPTGLIFIGVPGADAPAQQVTVTDVSAQPASYASSHLTYDGADWLSHGPLNAVVLPDQPGQIQVQASFTGLSAGVRRGVITLLFTNGQPLTITALSVAAPGAPPAKNGINAAAGCTSANLRVAFTSLRDGFAAVVGQPLTVEVKAADDCGNLLVPESGAATPLVARFSNGDPDLRLTHTGGGTWVGTWRPLNPSTGPVTVTVYAAYVRLGTQATQQAGQVALQGTLRNSSTPLVAPGALVHAATFEANMPVAPGGLISLFGANLASGEGAAPGLPLPQDINQTEVLLGGMPLPLLYTSTGQINAQVPYGLTVNTQQQVVVQRGTALSVPESFTVAPAQPGIFTKNMQGTGQGIIMKSDQVTMAEPRTPALRGETIVVYCAGLGSVKPPVAPGSPAPTPAAVTENPVELTIGGKKAQVIFAGLTPGLAGLYQINAVVPADATTGDAVPVVIQVAGASSQPVTMAVR